MDAPDTPPEVTIEPADNGFIVRHHQRGDGKKTEGRTIRRLAMTKDEALGHAGTALGGARLKKKSHGRGGGALAMDTAEGTTRITLPGRIPCAAVPGAVAREPEAAGEETEPRLWNA